MFQSLFSVKAVRADRNKNNYKQAGSLNSSVVENSSEKSFSHARKSFTKFKAMNSRSTSKDHSPTRLKSQSGFEAFSFMNTTKPKNEKKNTLSSNSLKKSKSNMAINQIEHNISRQMSGSSKHINNGSIIFHLPSTPSLKLKHRGSVLAELEFRKKSESCEQASQICNIPQINIKGEGHVTNKKQCIQDLKTNKQLLDKVFTYAFSLGRKSSTNRKNRSDLHPEQCSQNLFSKFFQAYLPNLTSPENKNDSLSVNNVGECLSCKKCKELKIDLSKNIKLTQRMIAQFKSQYKKLASQFTKLRQDLLNNFDSIMKNNQLASSNMKIASKTTDGQYKVEYKAGDVNNSNIEYSDCEIITKKIQPDEFNEIDNFLQSSFENYKNCNNEDSAYRHKGVCDGDISSFSMSSIGKIIKNRAFNKAKINEQNKKLEQSFSHPNYFQLPPLTTNSKFQQLIRQRTERQAVSQIDYKYTSCQTSRIKKNRRRDSVNDHKTHSVLNDSVLQSHRKKESSLKSNSHKSEYEHSYNNIKLALFNITMTLKE